MINKLIITTIFLRYFSGTSKKGKPFYGVEVMDLDHEKRSATVSSYFLDKELTAADKYQAGDSIEVTLQFISKEEIKLLSINKVTKISTWFDTKAS